MNKIFPTLLITIAFISPVLLLIIQSFAGPWPWPNLLPTTWNTRSWSNALTSRVPIVYSLGNSLLYSLAATFLGFLLCIMPASALTRGSLPPARRRIIEILLMSPIMVPPITFTLGIHHVFLRIGLADTWAGVVIVLCAYSYPYMLRALMNGFRVTGEHYVISARNLGAGPLGSFTGIELPLLVPAITTGGSVMLLAAFSDYYLVFLFGGGAVRGYSSYLFPFLNSSDSNMAALLTLIFIATPLILFGIMELILSRWYKHWKQDV